MEPGLPARHGSSPAMPSPSETPSLGWKSAMGEVVANPRLWSLGLVLALALFAVLTARRRMSDVVASEELGGAPLALEVEVQDDGERRRYRAAHSLLIGRSPSAAISLSDPTVSRVHARIERRGIDA